MLFVRITKEATASTELMETRQHQVGACETISRSIHVFVLHLKIFVLGAVLCFLIFSVFTAIFLCLSPLNGANKLSRLER